MFAAAWGLSAAIGCGGGSESGVHLVTEVLVEGLANPTAVIVASDGSALVAESAAGRIVSVGTDGTLTPLISGFEVGTFAPYAIGPLSMLERADGGLIVGEGGNPPGQERVSFWATDGTSAGTALVPLGGGDFYGLALQSSTGNLLIASASTDRIFAAGPDEPGGFSEPVVVIDDTTEEPIAAAAPTALAFDAEGLLYVGFAGEGSSRIVRIDTQTSFVEPLVQTDSSVTGIAFRPSDSLPFFAVFGDAGRASGAVFSIGTNGVASEFAGGLAGPTALAFDSTDALYVTTLGTPADAGAGQLLKITVEVIEEEEEDEDEEEDEENGAAEAPDNGQ